MMSPSGTPTCKGPVLGGGAEGNPDSIPSPPAEPSAALTAPSARRRLGSSWSIPGANLYPVGPGRECNIARQVIYKQKILSEEVSFKIWLSKTFDL